VIRIGELVAKAGEIAAGTAEFPQANLFVGLELRFRCRPNEVKVAVHQLEKAGVVQAKFAGASAFAPLKRLIYVPKELRNRQPASSPSTPLQPGPPPPLTSAPPTAPPPAPAPASPPAIFATPSEERPRLGGTAFQVFWILCIFAEASGNGSDYTANVLRPCIRLSSRAESRIIDELESDGLVRRRLGGYWVNPERRTSMFPDLQPWDRVRGPSVTPPSGRELDNTLTLEQVGELDLVCLRFLSILREAQPDGDSRLKHSRVILRQGWEQRYGKVLADEELELHLSHLTSKGLFKGYSWGFEVNISVPVERSDT
jgi:hypothetical protein